MGKGKILVCSHWLEIGGAESALIGLLDELVKSEYEIHLFLCRHTGELMPHIPEGVHLLPEDVSAACVATKISDAIRCGAIGTVLGRAFAKIRSWRHNPKEHMKDSNRAIEYSHRYVYKFVRSINPGTKYDLVLSFLAPHYIAAFRTTGKVKVAWIHTDYKAIDVDATTEKKVWEKFDKIVAVSSTCAQSFTEVYPTLADRVVVIENIMSAKLVHQQTGLIDVSTEMPDDSLRLLSIGRFCFQKNFDNVPEICARLLKNGLNVKWYIVGFGEDEQLLRQKIAEANMKDRVIILGKKENPYPYIKACDLYVQPSRYEGKSVCVREAQLLGKPVVITNYATSSSQLENGVDGVIVPMDNEGCASGISELLRAPEQMKMLIRNCRMRDYTNGSEIQKIISFVK